MFLRIAQRVSDPLRYGDVELDNLGGSVKLLEKPGTPGSDLAVAGLHPSDHTVFSRPTSVKPSVHGEL